MRVMHIPGWRSWAGYLGALPAVHPVVGQGGYDVGLQGGGARPQKGVDHPKKGKRQSHSNDQETCSRSSVITVYPPPERS